MKKTLLLTLCFLIPLSSCVCFKNGYGLNASDADIKKGVIPRRNITFSVEYTNRNFWVWMGHDDAVLTIRRRLEQSGLFGFVNYVYPQQAGPYHLHFEITGSQSDKEAADLAFILISGGSCFLVPTWRTYSLDCSMSVIHRGREVCNTSSQQEAKEVVWLPCVLGAPFFNHFNADDSMIEGAVNYFLTEIQRNRFNETLN